MRKAPAGSPRPLLEDVAHSPARAPQEIWQPPRGSREREVTAPWHLSHQQPLVRTRGVCGRPDTGPETPKPLPPRPRGRPCAQRCTRTRVLGALLPATVGGRQGKGEGRNDREEGGARPLGRRLLSRRRRNSFPAKETPGDAPMRSAASPQLTDSPASGLSSTRPGPPCAHELILDVLPAAFRGTQARSRLPAARATGGSLGL